MSKFTEEPNKFQVMMMMQSPGRNSSVSYLSALPLTEKKYVSPLVGFKFDC
jgi:hypothetical protein